MQLQGILLTLGVGVLYIGYAGVLGVLIRRARSPQRRTADILLALAHAALLFLPASIVVLGMGDLPVLVRLILLALGLTVTAVGWVQPPWTPDKLWRRAFGYRYFALAMGTAAVWGLSSGISMTSLALGAAAGIACALTLNLTLSDPLR